MKTLNKLTITAATFASLTFLSSSLYAGGSHDDGHDNDHNEAMEYEHTMNEFGMYDQGMEVTRTIEVNMSDQMRFTPDVIKVNKGDVIKFVHTNTGKIMHEFVLGTQTTLDEHAEMMKKFPNMEHSEPYMTHVAPGEKGEIIWQFSNAGTFAFGCLIPGHYDAGMKGTVVVES